MVDDLTVSPVLSTAPQPFVFVLMPFDRSFDDVYQLGIKPACANAGAYAERVDEQMFEGSILRRLYNQIGKADVIIADMTGRNANVFYEVGYAHALGKRVILLTQKVDDIPFDLKDYPHIVYGGRITDLRPELQRRVRWFLDQPKQASAMPWEPKFFFKGQAIVSGALIMCREGVYPLTLPIQIDALNPAERVIKNTSFSLALQTSDFFYASSKELYGAGEAKEPLTTIVANGRILHIPEKDFSIRPGAWQSISFYLHANEKVCVGLTEQVCLRVSSDDAFREYEFAIRVVGR